MLLIAAIAAAGSLGITLLWVIDMRVYHQLLDACFIAGLHLENRYEWLPPMRRNMMKTQRGLGVTSRVIGFYLVPILVLELISGAAVISWLMKIH